MTAILDARPGMTSRLREIVAELARQDRREPGCLDFTAYQARDTPDRFYLYEVYGSAAAFDEHLQTQLSPCTTSSRPFPPSAPQPGSSCNSMKPPSTRALERISTVPDVKPLPRWFRTANEIHPAPPTR